MPTVLPTDLPKLAPRADAAPKAAPAARKQSTNPSTDDAPANFEDALKEARRQADEPDSKPAAKVEQPKKGAKKSAKRATTSEKGTSPDPEQAGESAVTDVEAKPSAQINDQQAGAPQVEPATTPENAPVKPVTEDPTGVVDQSAPAVAAVDIRVPKVPAGADVEHEIQGRASDGSAEAKETVKRSVSPRTISGMKNEISAQSDGEGDVATPTDEHNPDSTSKSPTSSEPKTRQSPDVAAQHHEGGTSSATVESLPSAATEHTAQATSQPKSKKLTSVENEHTQTDSTKADATHAASTGASDTTSTRPSTSPSIATPTMPVLDPASTRTLATPISHAPAAATDARPAPTSPEIDFAASNHPRIVSAIRGELIPGGGTMQIRLDPPELGALQISVRLQDGVMTASFHTSSDEATRLLSHSLSQLKTVLETQGVSVEKLHVQQSPRDERGGNDSANHHNQHAYGDQTSARQEQQRREMLRRMWRRLSFGSDPLDMVA